MRDVVMNTPMMSSSYARNIMSNSIVKNSPLPISLRLIRSRVCVPYKEVASQRREPTMAYLNRSENASINRIY